MVFFVHISWFFHFVKKCWKCDETLVNYIKQRTQVRGTGRAKRENPSPSQKHKNPKESTKDQVNK